MHAMLRTLLTLLVALLLAVSATAAPPLRGYKIPEQAAAAAKDIAALTPQEKKALFKSWKGENGKKYADGSAEDGTRFAAFSANLAEVARWNAQPAVRYFKGINAFSDLTFEQFKAQMLMNVDNAELDTRAQAAPKLASTSRAGRKLQQSVPNQFDWRSLGKVPPPRNQGGCGSCWAFAAAGALESKAMIDGWTAGLDVSEQQFVDCVNAASGYGGTAGCNGGYSEDALKYTSNLFTTSEAAYPYTGVGGTCKVSAGTTPPTGALKVAPWPGYTTVAGNADAIMNAVATTGPVIIYFNVQSSFYGYTSGVYQASSCTTETINHAMVVVGYNKTAGVGSPDSYWIIRNSWGLWGDAGYIKVQMTADSGIGACAMYRWAKFLPLTTSSAAPIPCTACAANQYCASGTCATCPTNCASCTGPSTCTACKPGWKGATCSEVDCGSSCATNQFCAVVNGAPGCAVCPINCASCTGARTCTSCLPGWKGATCSQPDCGSSCATNQFCAVVNGAPTCASCPTNCLSCTSATSCTSCTYGLTGSMCGTTCGKQGASCKSGGQCCSGVCKKKRCQ